MRLDGTVAIVSGAGAGIAAAFLEDASHVNGQMPVVDGGDRCA